MAFIKAYTRDIIDRRTYPSALAQSVHFAVSLDGDTYTPLNNNYGILFPKAEINDQNGILERGAQDPRILHCDGEYLVFAEYVDADGKVVYPDRLWLWITADLCDFRECGLVLRSEYGGLYEKAETVAPVSIDLLRGVVDRYVPLRFMKAELPDAVTVSDVSELDSTKARCRYSDGSYDEKTVIWDRCAVTGKGTFTVTGEIFEKEYPMPCIHGFADPTVFYWEGKWYFLATNDNTGDVGLYLAAADTPEGLFADGNYPVCILPYNEEKGHVQTFWAPEFHVIGGELYILFALGGKVWAPQSHLMKHKGGDLLSPDSWCDPVRVMKKDGSYLVSGEITLDMTHFEAAGRHYYAWSQRTFSPIDSGSMIYVGEISPDDPYRLISDPVLIARPLYGWENQNGTVNNEGPFPIYTDGKIRLAYSGGSAGGYSYSLGYLTVDENADILSAESWDKTITPMLTSFDFTNLEGAGHNAFFVDDDGKMKIIYHAQKTGQDNRRNTYIHRVHYNAAGIPLLNMIPERDLPDDKRGVSITVTVK